MALTAQQETALTINAMRYVVCREQAYRNALKEYPECTREWFNKEYDEYVDGHIPAVDAELAPEAEVCHD